MKFETSELLSAVEQVRSTGDMISIRDYNAGSNCSENEFCLFIKPELCSLPALNQVLLLVSEKLAEFKVKTIACRAIGSKYLSHHRIMQQHYGVIDTISRHGRSAISSDAERKLQPLLQGLRVDNANILGAHQFLARFKTFSPDALSILYDNLSNNKLSGGTHCALADIRGVPILIFNGFHPEQLDHYEKEGQAILVFVARSTMPWKSLRDLMTGSTNPTKAASGSIRNGLLRKKDELGIDEVSTGRNGVHVSAGPAEGAAEIRRFFRRGEAELSLEHVTFSKCLLDAGLSADLVAKVIGNQTIPIDGNEVPAFDATEEIDSVQAITLLARG